MPGDEERLQRQTRYAVVLNGGVSLAVWMGGVTHELNRLRFASDAPGTNNTAAWEKILEYCKRTAVIDIVAGTSAGGLNGTLLATAVARGADLPPMRDVWADVASLDVGKLTRKRVKGATSLLDGDFFEDQVRSVLGKVQPQDHIEPRECTLLVTSTALSSAPRPTVMEGGNRMFTRDGRRVYEFTRTVGPVSRGSSLTDDFRPADGCVAALTQAARASASFPVAFTPVRETEALVARSGESTQPGRWLADGGILDNAPFEPLLKVLRKRPINEPFERVLLYVTPGTSRGEDSPPPQTPPPLAETLGLVLSASREPDERLDADALKRVFRQMSYRQSQAFRKIQDYLCAPGTERAAPMIQAAEALLEEYRATRTEVTQRWLQSRSGLPAVLAPPGDDKQTITAVPGIPTDSFPAYDGTTWAWGWTAADRILRWWGRALSRLNCQSPDVLEAMKTIAEAQREVTALWKPLEEAVSGGASAPVKLDDQLEAMRALFQGGLSEALTAAMIPTAQTVADAIPGVDAQTLVELSLAVEVVSGVFSWGGGQYDVPTFRFQNVTPAVETPPGIDLDHLDEKPDWPTMKLYGERLNHFGAFASRSGRAHDWLWGRLDGASELSRQLLRDVPGGEADRLRFALIEEILASEGISAHEVAVNARHIYEKSGGELIKEMDAADRGAAFRQLEATMWELTQPLNAGSLWVQGLLAGQWSPNIEERLGLVRAVALRSARAATTPLRRFLRRKLPRGMR